MKNNLNKIGEFLKGLNLIEYRHLELVMQFRTGIQEMIKRHNLSVARVCELFNITEEEYEDYTLGNYEYQLSDLAYLNAAHNVLESELAQKKIDENAPIQVPQSEKK